MSNPLAISTVNAAFKRRVLAAASAAVDTAKVRLGAPTAKLADDGKAVVNIHFYRAEPNAASANAHMPTRAADGSDRRNSRLALNLHYVMSFYGDAEKFEPDLMLAAVMLALEDEPVLSRQTIERAVEDNDDLEDSDLYRALGRVRVTRELMSLDDFSKVWSIFYQVPYALSLVYVASHVSIETDLPPRASLPVAQAALWISPLSALRLDRVSGAPDRPAPPVWGGTLHVTGQGLSRPGLGLAIDRAEVDLAGVASTPTTLALPLVPARFGGGELRVGVHALRVLAPPEAGRPAHLRTGSNVLAFALHPSIVPGAVNAPGGGATADGDITVSFAPAVAADQDVRLLLDARDPAAPNQHSLPAPERDADSAPVAQLTFDFEDLPRGDYLVRADVDGLVSQVAIDTGPASPTFGQISGPVVTI